MGGALCMAHAVSVSKDSTRPAASQGSSHNTSPARFGFIITKAVGGAVQRNLVRRRMKAIADEMLRAGVSDMDVVFRAFPAAFHADYATLRQEMFRQVTRLTKKGKGQR